MDPLVHCYYGNEAHVITSWTNLNHNRKFLECQKYKVILCLFVKYFKFIIGVFVDMCSICWYKSMEVVDSSCRMMVPCVIDQSK